MKLLAVGNTPSKLETKSPALIPNAVPSTAASLTFNGRSLALNQMFIQIGNTVTESGVTVTVNSDKTLTISGGNTSSSTLYVELSSNNIQFLASHKYYIQGLSTGLSTSQAYTYISQPYKVFASAEEIWTPSSSGSQAFKIYLIVVAGYTFTSSITLQPQIIDLAQMFGSGNEPTSIDQLKEIIDLDKYIPYNPGVLIHANNEWCIDKFNQLRNNKIASSGNGLSISTNSNNLLVIKNTATDSGVFAFALQSGNPLIKNHKYFIYYSQKETTHDYRIYVYSGNTYVSNTGRIQSSKILTADNDNINYKFAINTSLDEVFDDVVNLMIIDLTDIFGAGKEPTSVDVVKTYFKGFGIDLDIYQPYTPLGSVYSDNGRVDLGFNIWDEDWELGSLNTTTGENDTSSTTIRSKNYIPVDASGSYYFSAGLNVPSGTAWWTLFYTANKTVITSGLPSGANSSNNARQLKNLAVTMPANCAFIRFYLTGAYGTTYNNNICINKSLPTTTNNTAYNFRKTGTSVAIEDREDLSIVGGTVVWNQIIPATTARTLTTTDTNWVLSNSSTLYTNIFDTSSTHKYLMVVKVTSMTSNASFRIRYPYITTITAGTSSFMFTSPNNAMLAFQYMSTDGESATVSLPANCVQCFDLTLMFGSTIADYIYSLGNANGPAYFRKLFPKSYYAYNAGELISVNTSAHSMTGINQWDEQWELGTINNSTGQNEASTSEIRCKNYIRVLPSTTYCATNLASDKGLRYYWYDENKTFISSNFTNQSNLYNLINSPSNAYYLKIRPTNNYGKTYNHDICINISDSAVNGTYEPYNKTTYSLDNTVTLRGIPKLDANNKLWYDGDTYMPDGTVTHKYGVVDLGTLTWTAHTNDGLDNVFETAFSPGSNAAVCSKYVSIPGISAFNETDKAIRVNKTNQTILIHDSAFSNASSAGIAAFQSAMNGVYLVYELATPTTEQASTFTVPQKVSAYGTEEFVDTRDVAIPVGTNTTYFHHGNLYNGKYLPYYPMYGIGEEFNIWDEQWEAGAYNSSGQPIKSETQIRSKNYIPVYPNTTYYRYSGSSYSIAIHYFDTSKTFISGYGGTGTFTTPSNAAYIRFYTAQGYGTTYNNNICINLSQSNTSVTPHNGQYRPYPIKNTFDCVTGELVQRVGIVDLGTFDYTKLSTGQFRGLPPSSLTNIKTNEDSVMSNTLVVGFVQKLGNEWAASVNSSNYFYVSYYGASLYSQIVAFKTTNSDDRTAEQFKAAMSGVMMVYELATPTTSTKTPQSAALLNGQFNRKYGIVDLGSLTWSYSSSTHRMYIDGWASAYGALLPIDDNTQAHLMCTKYVTATAYQTQYNQINQAASLALSGALCVYDSIYTNAADFKAAMQGIYLIYELAQPVTGSPTYATSANYIREVDGGVKGMSFLLDYWQIGDIKLLKADDKFLSVDD